MNLVLVMVRLKSTHEVGYAIKIPMSSWVTVYFKGRVMPEMFSKETYNAVYEEIVLKKEFDIFECLKSQFIKKKID